MLNHLDYHIATDQLVAAGNVMDYSLKSTSSNANSPSIVLYKGPTKDEAWAKWINKNDVFTAATFSGNGAIIVGHLSKPIVVFIRAIDGGIINSQTYSPSYNQYESPKRNIAVTSDSVPTAYISKRLSTTTPSQ